MKKPLTSGLGHGRGHQKADEGGAGAVAHQGDRIRVAAEGPHIFLKPVKRGNLIEKAKIADYVLLQTRS